MNTLTKIQQLVIDFWFNEPRSDDWFSSSKEVDEKIQQQFTEIHQAVAAGELWRDRTSPEAYLAEVIVLDQFSRNLFRNNPRSFAFDGQALTLAQEAILRKYDMKLEKPQRMFFIYAVYALRIKKCSY